MIDSFPQYMSHNSPDTTTASSPSSSSSSPDAEEKNQIHFELDKEGLQAASQVSLILNEIVRYQMRIDEKCRVVTKSNQSLSGSSSSSSQILAYQSFNNLFIPTIPVLDYLHKIIKTAQLDSQIPVIALFQIDRLIRSNPTFTIHPYNCHRLLLVSLMVASKMHLDIQVHSSTLKLFSLLGGVSTQELFIMEQEFLSLLDYKLFISTEEFETYRKSLFATNF